MNALFLVESCQGTVGRVNATVKSDSKNLISRHKNPGSKMNLTVWQGAKNHAPGLSCNRRDV